MPTFCRHNRLVQNCPICSREQGVEMRPLVTSATPGQAEPRERRTSAERGDRATTPRTSSSKRSGAGVGKGGGKGGVRVRRLARGADDGFRSPLVPGLKSSEDADRLAVEIAFAAARLTLMDSVRRGESADAAPPVWTEIAGDGDIEARTKLAVETVISGPRGAGDETGQREALGAYEAWVERNGSQQAAFTGEQGWTPERRFERIFERTQFGGLGRDPRFELLTLLGHLGLYELRAGRLFLTGENEATWAAKRVFGIGDPLLLERRAADFARACAVPLDSLDLAFHNWGPGVRVGVGIDPDTDGDPDVLDQARDALGL